MRLEFNARIDKVRSRLQVTTPGGRKADVADLPRKTNPTSSRAPPLTAVRAGAYVLRWQVLAIDGRITRGDIPFMVGN